MVVRVGGQRGVSSVVDETTSPSQQLQEDLAKSQGQPTVSGELEKIIEQSNQPQATAEIETSELEGQPVQQPVQDPVEQKLQLQQPNLRMEVQEQADIDPAFLGAIDPADRNLYERGIFNTLEEEQNRDTRRYNFKGGLRKNSVSTNGGIFDRSEELARITLDPDEPIGIGGLLHPKPLAAGQVNPTSKLGKTMLAANATVVDQTTGANIINPEFLRVASLITEDVIADQTMAEARKEEQELAKASSSFDDMGGEPIAEVVEPLAITKMQRNAELGGRLLNEWGKLTGTDTSGFNNNDKTALGDMMKELYFEVNKGTPEAPLLLREQRPDGQVEFKVTNLGQAMFRESQKVRKLYFPKEHVDALSEPRSTGKIRVSGARKPIDITHHQEILDAVQALESIPHWVIPRREKILLATLLPALANGNASPEIIEMSKAINGFGADKLAAFNAKKKIKEFQGDPTFDVMENMEILKRNIAQSLYGIAKHRGSPAYLTYFVQAFNGRLTPEQSHFNPVSNKQVRFVTGNPEPALLIPGSNSQVDRNLREMYSMMILKIKGIGAGSLLTKERLEMFDEGYDNLVNYGKVLKEALDNSTIDADKISEAILKGIPMDSPEFPQFQGLNLDPKYGSLINAIAKKGEDGLSLIDGLIDIYEYDQVKQENVKRKQLGQPLKQFRTHYNAYIDGKTNGLATNGLQLGLKEIALRTGVLRSDDSIFAVDGDKDLRDVLAERLADAAQNIDAFRHVTFDQYGGDENALAFHAVVNKLFQTRALNKATTMTFGYGKELDSFKEDIRNYLVLNQAEAVQSDPELAAHYEVLEAAYKGDDTVFDAITNDIHEMYIDKLIDVITPEGIKARKMMYNMAMFHVMMDEVFELETPTGMPIYLGGTEVLTQEDPAFSQQYSVLTDEAEGGKRKVKAIKYKTKATAAAIRGEGDKGYIGGAALGGSNPAPVQSVDAATVARTFSGKSWNKIKAATATGKGYGLQIYDAFKTDALTHHVIYKEVNTNWLNTNKEYFYLDMANRKMEEAIKRFQSKMLKMPNRIVSIGPESSFRKIGDLLTFSMAGERTNKDGATVYGSYPALENFLMRNVERAVVDADGVKRKRTEEEMAEAADEMLQELFSILRKKGIDAYDVAVNKRTMTQKELLDFVTAISNVLDFKKDRDKFIAERKAARIDNFNDIDRNVAAGKVVAQYHDH